MKFDVLVCTPTSGMCRAAFAFSLARLAMYFNQVPIYPEIKEQSMQFLYWEGTGVSHNREKMIREMLKNDCTHLLFIDDDMGFNPNVLHILASRRQPIVGCNYRIRTPPGLFMAVDDKSNRVPTTKEKTGLEPVLYMGFGFCLIERRVFEDTKEPRFLPQYISNPETGEGVYTTEDVVFFANQPYPVYIDHDASKLIWHSGNILYTWADDFSNINQNMK
jgi:hypothetical protein